MTPVDKKLAQEFIDCCQAASAVNFIGHQLNRADALKKDKLSWTGEYIPRNSYDGRYYVMECNIANFSYTDREGLAYGGIKLNLGLWMRFRVYLAAKRLADRGDSILKRFAIADHMNALVAEKNRLQ